MYTGAGQCDTGGGYKHLCGCRKREKGLGMNLLARGSAPFAFYPLARATLYGEQALARGLKLDHEADQSLVCLFFISWRTVRCKQSLSMMQNDQ